MYILRVGTGQSVYLLPIICQTPTYYVQNLKWMFKKSDIAQYFNISSEIGQGRVKCPAKYSWHVKKTSDYSYFVKLSANHLFLNMKSNFNYNPIFKIGICGVINWLQAIFQTLTKLNWYYGNKKKIRTTSLITISIWTQTPNIFASDSFIDKKNHFKITQALNFARQ